MTDNSKESAPPDAPTVQCISGGDTLTEREVPIADAQPTPETDVAEFSANDAQNIMCVRSDFARTLERDRDRLRARLAIENCPAGKGDPPMDCNFPFCGCDPIFNDVIEALQECGWLPPQHLEKKL